MLFSLSTKTHATRPPVMRELPQSKRLALGNAAIGSPSLMLMAMLALALFALFLPIVGPLDDHHFAERTHTHGHIYLDGQPVPHQHPLDSDALHSHAAGAVAAPTSPTGAAPTGIAHITTPAGSLLLAVLNAPWHRTPEPMRPAPTIEQDGNPLSPFSAARRQPGGRPIPPPVPPPTA